MLLVTISRLVRFFPTGSKFMLCDAIVVIDRTACKNDFPRCTNNSTQSYGLPSPQFNVAELPEEAVSRDLCTSHVTGMILYEPA